MCSSVACGAPAHRKRLRRTPPSLLSTAAQAVLHEAPNRRVQVNTPNPLPPPPPRDSFIRLLGTGATAGRRSECGGVG